MMDPALRQKNNVSAAWLIYGIARHQYISFSYPHLSSYKYEFIEEYGAREALVKGWIDLSGNSPAERDAYLDELAIVYKAGYLKEYVWTLFHFADPAPPVGLRLAQFTQWMAQNLPQHQVQTLVGIQIK